MVDNKGAFLESLSDYVFLINKNYPEKETLKLVGDKYRLSGIQRTILYRGITTEERILLRRSKMTKGVKGQPLYVDSYNVLFTIMNYMMGKQVFIGNDGIVRDAGSNLGKIKDQTLFDKAMVILFDVLKNIQPASVTFYFDRPVANSSNHKKKFTDSIDYSGLNGTVLLVKTVDHELSQIEQGIIATSDSQIIDKTTCNILDLARIALEHKFQLEIMDLNLMIE